MTNSVKLYLSEIPADFTPDITRLNAVQTARAQGFSGKRLREYLASRALLSHALEAHWEVDESNPKWPRVHCVSTNTRREISLSHSNNWVAVAIAPIDSAARVGVDIEKIRGNWSTEKVDFFCNERQSQCGLALPVERQAEFFSQLWTKKESYFKATQKPFVKKDFAQDPGCYSHRLNDAFFVSVYSEPALAVDIQAVTLATG